MSVHPESSRGTLLAQVLANPDLDGPRRVMADWLTELGKPRGEFISVQCERETAEPGSERYGALWAREKDLQKRYAATWTPFFKKLSPRPEYTFRRGFLEHVKLRGLPGLAAAVKRVVEAEPVTALTLDQVQDHLNEVEALLPAIARIRALEIVAYNVEAELFRILKKKARFTELRWLRVGYFGGDEGARLVAETSCFATVRQLHLSHGSISDEGVRHLCTLTGIEHLDLSNNRITDAGVALLVATKHLKSVSLSANPRITKVGRALLDERFVRTSSRSG